MCVVSMAMGNDPPKTLTKELLDRIRLNRDTRALSRLFRDQRDRLLRWARGRLPRWARRGSDTVDLVQDALVQTFQRIDGFEDRGHGSLQAYLRRAVSNRITDEMRRVVKRPIEDLTDVERRLPAAGAGPHEYIQEVEWEQRYKSALQLLTPEERALVVARLELDYSYEQLAMMSGRATAGAARIAARRAVAKLAEKMASG
jgi:RNA polymerase sigma factor (sigma-70 family)